MKVHVLIFIMFLTNIIFGMEKAVLKDSKTIICLPKGSKVPVIKQIPVYYDLLFEDCLCSPTQKIGCFYLTDIPVKLTFKQLEIMIKNCFRVEDEKNRKIKLGKNDSIFYNFNDYDELDMTMYDKIYFKIAS